MAALPARRVVVALLLLIASLPACATRGGRDRELAPVPYRLIAPSLDRASLSPTERRGYDLYLRDVAAHRATDAALSEAGLAQSGTRGWIVVPYERGFLVRFIDANDRAIIDVSIDPWSALSPFVIANHPSKPLSAREAAMWRARERVMREPIQPCSERYNSVVLPESDDEDAAWLVYLLASSSDPHHFVVGGHHRFRVDAEGREILEAFPLSRGCMTPEYDPASEGFVTTQLVAPEPVETHVFLSLLHGFPIYVSIVETKTLWVVEGGRMRKSDEPVR